MTSFDARLRLLGQSGLPLGVEVDLDGERMKVTAGDNVLADWLLDDITISIHADGFHIKAEGEEIVLNVSDQAAFASIVGLPTDRRDV
jgi:hypothetical protein